MKQSKPKKLSVPKWKKRRGELVYDIIDPVTGGRWVIAAIRDMTDAELNAQVSGLLTFCAVERPKRGQTWLFENTGG